MAVSRACLKNVNMSKRRLFFRHTLPIFLEIHPVFLRQIGFVWRKNFSPLVTFPFFKRRLIETRGTKAAVFDFATLNFKIF